MGLLCRMDISIEPQDCSQHFRGKYSGNFAGKFREKIIYRGGKYPWKYLMWYEYSFVGPLFLPWKAKESFVKGASQWKCDRVLVFKLSKPGSPLVPPDLVRRSLSEFANLFLNHVFGFFWNQNVLFQNVFFLVQWAFDKFSAFAQNWLENLGFIKWNSIFTSTSLIFFE